jgi:hypothetical protein
MTMELPRKTVLALLAAVTVTMIAFSFPSPGPASMDGLDPGWMIGIGSAVSDGLVFGRDVVFTYGPLGPLSVRVGLGFSTWAFAVFDLALLFLTLVAVYRVARSGRFGLLFGVWIILLTLAWNGKEMIHLLIVLYLVVTLLDAGRLSSTWAIVSGLLGSVIFLTKVSTGIVVLTVLVFSALGAFVNDRFRTRIETIIRIAAFVLGVVIISSIYPIDVAAYVRDGVELSRGYSMAMSVGPQGTRVGIYKIAWVLSTVLTYTGFLSAGGLLLLSARSTWTAHRRNRERSVLGSSMVIWLASATAIAFFFRQGLTRADLGHLAVSAAFTPLVLVLMTALHQSGWKYPADDTGRPSLETILLLTALLSFGGVLVTFAGIEAYRGRPTRLTLPDYVRSIGTGWDEADWIGQGAYFEEVDVASFSGSGFDVVPYSISWVISTGLTYQPRPIIQSYSAYTSQLTDTNADYLRETEDLHVVLHSGAIDGKYWMFEDPASMNELIANWRVQDRLQLTNDGSQDEQEILLLSRMGDSAPKFEEQGAARVMPLADWVEIPASDTSIYATIDVDERSLAASVLGMLYHRQWYLIDFRLDDGAIETHRLSPVLSQSPGLVSHYIADSGAFDAYLSDHDSAYVDAIRVRPFGLSRLLGRSARIQFYAAKALGQRVE